MSMAVDERFTQSVKTCRGILVDDVEHHLGVPIIGKPTALHDIAPGDVEAARFWLAKAIDTLSCDPGSADVDVQAWCDELHEVSGLLSAAARTSTGRTRRLRLARARLRAVVDALSTALHSGAGHDDDPSGSHHEHGRRS